MANIKGSKRGKYNLKVANKGYFKDQGKKLKDNCKTCNKEFFYYLSLRKGEYCSNACYHLSKRGKKRPEHSAFMKGKTFAKGFSPTLKTRIKISNAIKGEKHYNWKGGISTVASLVRNCVQYTFWRESVFKRDNWTCIWCKDKTGGNLEADHIKPFSIILKLNKIDTVEKAIQCEELWNIENGQTLCHSCHATTDTYGNNKICIE